MDIVIKANLNLEKYSKLL